MTVVTGANPKPTYICGASHCLGNETRALDPWMLRFCEVESLNAALKSLTVPWDALGRDRLEFLHAFSDVDVLGPIIHRWEEPCYSPVSSNMVSWKIPILFNEFLIKTHYCKTTYYEYYEHLFFRDFPSQPCLITEGYVIYHPAMFCATRPDVIRNFMGSLVLDTCNILPNILQWQWWYMWTYDIQMTHNVIQEYLDPHSLLSTYISHSTISRC